MSKIKMVCPECNSLEVLRDAYARWDIEAQDWVLSSTYDSFACNVCGANDIEPEEEEAMPLGYQVGDANGENIQGDENDPSGQPSFYIMGKEEISRLKDVHPWITILTIYEGDVEEPMLSPEIAGVEA